MPNRFDALLEEMENEGVLDPDWIERLREASAGSPLRKERDAAETKARQLEEENRALKSKLGNQVFTEVGIKVKPDLLNLPEDLDITDTEAVRAWAVDQGLAERRPDVDPDEMDEHTTINNASGGTEGVDTGILTPDKVSDWPTDKLLRLRESNPKAFEALKRGEEVRGVTV